MIIRASSTGCETRISEIYLSLRFHTPDQTLAILRPCEYRGTHPCSSGVCSGLSYRAVAEGQRGVPQVVNNHMNSPKSLLILLTALAWTAWTSSIVDLGYAKYRGTTNITTNVATFLGIRYAAAPIGDLRWRPPRPPSTSLVTLNATIRPPQCPQATLPGFDTSPPGTPSPSLPNDGTDSEDCLFLK